MSWPEVELGQICTFGYGKSLPADDRDGGEFPVYGSNGIVGSHSKPFTSGPTVVIGRKGSFGEVNYSDRRCWPIDTTYFVDQSSTDCDLRWLAYRLGALGLTTLNRAAAIPGLNREDAYRLRLLLPPLAEQRRIAAILDQADALRAKRHQVLAHLDSLTQSTFLATFGRPQDWPRRWHMGTIGDLAVQVDYGTAGKAYEKGEWPILRMGNVTDDGRLDLTDLKYIDLKPSEVPKYTVRAGDMLFNRTNSKEKVGKSAVVRTDQPLAVAGYLIRVRFDDSATSEFVSAYLTSAHGVAVRRRLAKAAVNQANINATEMRSIVIAHPSPEARQSFAAGIRRIELQRATAVRALTADDELFASLQSRAFRGEL